LVYLLLDMGEFVFKITTEILVYLKENSEKKPGIMNIVKDLGYHHRTISKYLNLLEKKGLIETQRVLGKNIVKITGKGECIVNCLLAGK